MEKVLYIAPVYYGQKRASGVEKKISYQCKAFSKCYEVYLLSYGDEGVKIIDFQNQKAMLLSKRKGGNSVLKAASSLKTPFDYVYIRYPLSSPAFLHCVRKMKKRSKKICVEIATYPYAAELKKGLKNKLMAFADLITRPFLKKYVQRIVTFSHDKSIFGIETINTINGVDFASVKEAGYLPSNDTHLIAVSSVYYLHGYDRLIEGLRIYYSLKRNNNLVFDIVGDGPYLEKYKALVDVYGLNKHVVFHGSLSGKELDHVYSMAVLAVNSLAIHRQHLTNESTIKSKEYAAKGLPIVSSSFVDSFSREDNDNYVFLVPPNDEPVNVVDLISFLERVYAGKQISDVRQTIRNNAKTICDINVAMEPVINFFKE